MENRVKTIVLGILTLGALAGCSGGNESGAPQTADAGGLDGGGSIGLGLSWEKGVFAQPIWVDGEPHLVVSNRRSEEISFGVFAVEWEGTQDESEPSASRGALLTQEVVPAHTTITLDATALVGPLGEILWISADNEKLGLLMSLQPPLVTGTLPVISNDWPGGGQIETDFSTLPSTNFEATVTLTKPGALTVQPPSSIAGVAFLTATGATSEDAVVTTTTDGFRVDLPAETSETTPARVQLSFNLPLASVSGSSQLVLDAGTLCTAEANVSDGGQHSASGASSRCPEPRRLTTARTDTSDCGTPF